MDRPSVWKRAGLDGVIVGLDIAEALAGMRAGLDREFCRRLLIVAEGAYLVAWHRHAAETKER